MRTHAIHRRSGHSHVGRVIRRYRGDRSWTRVAASASKGGGHGGSRGGYRSPPQRKMRPASRVNGLAGRPWEERVLGFLSELFDFV
jgi:hypothetical protein